MQMEGFYKQHVQNQNEENPHKWDVSLTKGKPNFKVPY